MDSDWEKIIRTYPAEKREWDSTYPWIYYIARPLSFPISWLLRKAGIGANPVTVLTAVLGFASLPLLAGGNRAWMAAGAFCLVLYTIFDCVDGNLARAWPETGSPAGQFWGELVGHFYLICYIPLSLSLGGHWPAFAAAVTACKLLGINIRHNFWQTLGGLWETSKQESAYSPYTGRWHYKIYYNLTDPQAHIFLLPVLILLGKERQFIAASLAISCADLAFILVFYLVRAGKVGSRKGQLL
jgi:phosphatidylglycerophosphate synthase